MVLPKLISSFIIHLLNLFHSNLYCFFFFFFFFDKQARQYINKIGSCSSVYRLYTRRNKKVETKPTTQGVWLGVLDNTH